MNTIPVYKWILATVGLVSLSVGVIGVFVPLLPTTVFLLIAAACFARSSDRLHDWLLSHKWFGPYIRNYREYRAMTMRSKVLAIGGLWGMIAYSTLAAVEMWWLRLLMLVIAISVTTYLLRLKTMTPEMAMQLESSAQGK